MIQFTANATDSLNLLIFGFASSQKEKFHVISSALEHNSVLRPLYQLQSRGLIDVTFLPIDKHGRISPSEVARSIRKDTKLIVMTHGSNVMGSVINIKGICEIANRRGIFTIIDGAQTAGMFDIDINDMGCDAFAFTGHKGLFGVSGVGGFYIRNPQSILQTKFGGTGIRSQSHSHPEDMPYRFEAGTHNYPGIASIAAGVSYIRSIGTEVAYDNPLLLAHNLCDKLSMIPNVILYNLKPEIPIVSFNIVGIGCEDVSVLLQAEYNVVSRPGLHCAPLVHEKITQDQGCVRLSFSSMNTEEECNIVGSAIASLARKINVDTL